MDQSLPCAFTTDDGRVLQAWTSRAQSTADDAPAVVLCHGFIQNRWAFQSARRSLLAHLRALGVHVYVVELRGRDGTRPAAGLVDYSDRDAAAVVTALAARHRAVAWIGHSMGGLTAALLPPAVAAKLAAVVTIGAPLLPGRAVLHVARVTQTAIRAARFAHARGLAFAGRSYSRGYHVLRGVLDVPRVPVPLRLWTPGALAADCLAYTLERSFADDSYAVLADLLELYVSDGNRAGGLDVGARVRAFERPLLVIAGGADHLAPPAGARPLFERVASADKTYVEVAGPRGGAGHIDLLIGEDAPAHVWGPLTTFLRPRLSLV